MEKEKNYSPSEDGQGNLTSPALQLAIEQHQGLMAENKRLKEEFAKRRAKLAKMEAELAKSREEARQAELRVYALNTLIDVADETYGLGLRKVLGESDQEDPHRNPKR